MKSYALEVYEPGSADDVLWYGESESPFMAVAAGDILSTPDAPGTTPTSLLKIIQVEHIIWNSTEGPKHKICLFTTAVENSRDVRLDRSWTL